MSEEHLLKVLLAKAPDAIVRIDRAGKILDYSGAAEQMFQFTAAEMIGQSVERLMLPVDAGKHNGYIQAYLSSGTRKLPDFGRRLHAQRKDGSTFPIEIALSQVGEGEQMEFVSIIRDISRRIRDEKRISEMRERMVGASQHNALAELAIQMAHEINQPLTAVTNYMDALELKLAKIQAVDVSDLKELTEKAANQARLAGEIVRGLRERIDIPAREAENGDFHEAVADVMAALSSSINLDDVEVVVEHVGPSRTAAFDHIQLHQVLANLVANALTALEKADPKRLIITSEVRGDELELRVSDSGPGVPEGRKTEIFESFVSDSLSGLGLGLAIAKRIAKGHSGHLWVEDGPDGGAVFRMVLPLQ